MGTLWDAMMEGYTQTDRMFETSDAVANESSTQTPQSAWDKLFTKPSGGSLTSGTKGQVDYDFVVDGLVKRGMPEHIAHGFAMNMEDESGFRAGINELKPIVPGSRGGYGLYQLTGPRRRQFEAMADQQGVSYDDADAQLDFLMYEIENDERGAWREIQKATNAGEAGALIVEKFLRPAKVHRDKRASKYRGGHVTQKSTNAPNKLWLEY